MVSLSRPPGSVRWNGGDVSTTGRVERTGIGRARALALVGMLMAGCLAVVAPVSVSPVSAAPGPMHAYDLDRWLGFSVSAVAESGEMYGTRYDAAAQRSHVMRATLAGAPARFRRRSWLSYPLFVAPVPRGPAVTPNPSAGRLHP